MTTFGLEIDIGADLLEPGDFIYTNFNVNKVGLIVAGCSEFRYKLNIF